MATHSIMLTYLCPFVCLYVSVETALPIEVTARGQFLNTTYNTGYVIKLIDIVGQKQCVRKCLQNGQCRSVNYWKRQLRCQMMRVKNGYLGVSLMMDPDSEYIEMINQPQELAGLCSDNSCETQCTALKSGDTFCSKENTCPSNYHWNSAHRLCFALYTDPLSWQEAVNFCNSFDRTRLAILDTTGKIEAVRAKSTGSSNYYWLGASYDQPGTPSYGENDFYWNTGEKVDPAFLSNYNPSHSSGFCLYLYTYLSDFDITSFFCSYDLGFAAVCEFIL